MQYVVYVLLGLFIGLLDYYFFKKETLAKQMVSIVVHGVVLNVSSLFIIRYVMGKPFVLNAENYYKPFVFKYILVTLLMGAIYLLVKGIIKRTIEILPRDEKIKKRWIALSVISSLLFGTGAFLYLGTHWFIDYFGKLTPEQFIFNFNSPVTGTASGVMASAMNGPVLMFLFLFMMFMLVVFIPFKLVNGQTEKLYVKDTALKCLGAIIAVGVVAFGTYYSMKELQLPKVYQAYFDDSPYIKDNYVSPKDVTLTFPTKKRNLIHLYLESYENSYFGKESGGYMEENLMPDLEELYKEGVHFSDNEKMGGPDQTYGSSWSVAAMVNMSMGLPLKIPMGGNAYGKSGYFLPGAIGIGDILNQEGYNQTVMFGADADFGGLTSFFNGHKDFKIFDLKYARQEGLIPEDYKVWWGYEDTKLYEYAKDELTRLASEDKPFNFTLENADTHFPDGYIEKGTPTPYDSQYANVILHSQKEMVKLVRWIQEQPFYEDTVIVMTGDHLSMDKNFFKDFDPSYKRSVTNLILNGDFEETDIKTTNREFSVFDFYPTVLSSMGVGIEGNKLGLGTDLTSSTPTLIERDGLEKVNNELSKNSKFYNQEFVSEQKVK